MQSMNSSGGGPPLPASAAISLCDDGTPNCPPAASFSVAALRDLIIHVTWENVPAGNHVQTLEILSPGGDPYQSTQTGFLISDATGGSFSSSRVLPVVGTWIPQRHLTGQWSVRASLDGQPIATQPVEFTP
ncbi:MAG: hypothetical protein WBP79_04510 [Candidatus Acidiferrales bacterium]